MKKRSFELKSNFSVIKKYLFLIIMILIGNTIYTQQSGTSAGWHFTSYEFKDGSTKNYSNLMGTSSKMYDTISYKGAKGNMTITHNRYDVKTGILLAGVSYQVIWKDPAALLMAENKSFVNFSLKKISSTKWATPHNSINLNHGLSGIYFVSSDGTKYFNTDVSTTLTSEKNIPKGTKGQKKTIQVNLGNGYIFTYNYEWRDGITVVPTEQPAASINQNAWHFTNYEFKNGSLKKYSNLMGTSSKMYDTISYKGVKGNMTITQDRYDVKTGKLLAGVTYQIVWTDPASQLIAGEESSVNFSLKTIATKSWTPPNSSVRYNQGIYGIYFLAPDGKKYFTKDVSTTLTTEKVIAEGSKGLKKFIQVNLGNGFMFTYNYEWR